MAKKKKDCDHLWRKTSSTYTHWHGLGHGTRFHRSCIRCSKIDWLNFIPCGANNSIQIDTKESEDDNTTGTSST